MNGKVQSERQEEFLRMRVFIPAAVSMGALLLLAVMLYFEQIHSGEAHQKQISRQSIRQIRIPARRGMIFTSDLLPLTENRPAFELLFYPGEMKRKTRSVEHILKCADAISSQAGLSHGLTKKSVETHLNLRPGLPIHVLRDLGDETAAKVMESARGIPGAEVQPMERRAYPEHTLACHLVGWTRPGDPRRAPDRKEYAYYLPDEVGVSGIEKLCDGVDPVTGQPGLRGFPGYSLIQVDRLGFVRKNLIERIDPVNGTHVVLTIDSFMQKKAEDLLRGRQGAVVAVDAGSGDILAAASSPGYDLQLFSPKILRSDYDKLRKTPGKPLFSRALQGMYPPGSIIKPLFALAYLREGIDPEKEIECTGSSEIYGIRIRCASHRRGGHGWINMHDAIKYSCNVYMIECAKQLGPGPLQRMLSSAGFGRKCGTGLPESAGLFPSESLKKRRSDVPWNAYDTALLSIGQGLIAVTPLQAAVYCAALANGGTVFQPNLIERTVDTAGQDLWVRTPVKKGSLPVSQEQLKMITDAMLDVVSSADGSGRNAAVDGMEIRGKTGSAEYLIKDDGMHVYAWFISYAKVGGRTIALAIVVEDGESGGKTCAPLAAEFFSSVQGR